MKRFILYLLFATIVQTGMAQIIKIDNGVAISSLSGDFSHKIYPYQVLISAEYCDKGWFNLTSGIGKITKGGKEEIPFTTEEGYTYSYEHINLYMDYLTFNTTFDLKYTKNRFTVYLGAGPRIDIKLKTRHSYSYSEFSTFTQGETNNLIYGINCVGGIRYLIGKIQLGINAGYLPSFNKPYTGLDQIKVSDKTFTLGLSVGYKL